MSIEKHARSEIYDLFDAATVTIFRSAMEHSCSKRMMTLMDLQAALSRSPHASSLIAQLPEACQAGQWTCSPGRVTPWHPATVSIDPRVDSALAWAYRLAAAHDAPARQGGTITPAVLLAATAIVNASADPRLVRQIAGALGMRHLTGLDLPEEVLSGQVTVEELNGLLDSRSLEDVILDKWRQAQHYPEGHANHCVIKDQIEHLRWHLHKRVGSVSIIGA